MSATVAVGHRTQVWAHRGDSAHHTENTLAAFTAAVSAGADGIEFDVRLTADGVPVIFHDHDLRRLADRDGSVESMTLAELARVRLRGDHAVPTLRETLEACPEVALNVELKVDRVGRGWRLVQAVAAVLADEPRPARLLVSSFDPIALAMMRAVAPRLARGVLFHREQPWPVRRGAAAYALAPTAVHPDRALVDAASVRRWHARGWQVNVWTVDEPAELRRLQQLGVDGVFANDPAAARAVLGA